MLFQNLLSTCSVESTHSGGNSSGGLNDITLRTAIALNVILLIVTLSLVVGCYYGRRKRRQQQNQDVTSSSMRKRKPKLKPRLLWILRWLWAIATLLLVLLYCFNGHLAAVLFDVLSGLELTEPSAAQNATCPSPESLITKPLDGECMETPPTSWAPPTYFSIKNKEQERSTCGLCGTGKVAEYLRELRDEIAKKYAQKCEGLVVYGAAFGKDYNKRNRARVLRKFSKRVVKRHGTCFFEFVTYKGGKKRTHSVDNSHVLIAVDIKRLPYSNNRRNVKLFKLNPGLFFPWAKRIIWQDAKLIDSRAPRNMPSDYNLHYERTVGHHATCASFVGLPQHQSTTQGNLTTLANHCAAIIAASRYRPFVSDSLNILPKQCREYYARHKNRTDSKGAIFHKHPLIDTAFIVWNMEVDVCRQFNANFGCTWFDEIHCFSDRDQVSFTTVLASSGLKLASTTNSTVADTHAEEDSIFVDKNEIPVIHIINPKCHWYFKSFSQCVAQSPSRMPIQREKTGGVMRVAIIVAGTLQRLMLNATLESLIRPLVKRNRTTLVDYYVSLTTRAGKAYRSNLAYMDHVHPDPIFRTLESTAEIEETIRTQIGSIEKAVIREVLIREQIDIDSEERLKSRRARAMKEHPEEDPDLRFPIFDIRKKEVMERTANANRNLLRLHLAVQMLWERAVHWEQEEDFKYDYVIFLRDDTFWINSFVLDRFLIRSEDVFLPSCDARDPPMAKVERNDHFLIAKRSSADVFGNYYSSLFGIDVEACMANLPRYLKDGGKRGCSSEMLLKWVIDQANLKVGLMNQLELPFQRSLNVALPDGSSTVCFHKFCQSRSEPLEIPDGFSMCKDLDWN